MPQEEALICQKNQKNTLINIIIPFCESLKGKVISQFVDIEKHIGYLITKLITKNNNIPVQLVFDLIINTHGLDRKIQILEKMTNFLDPKNTLDKDFFKRLHNARKTRNHFAHGAIVFIQKENRLIPVFNHDHSIEINDQYSKSICSENYDLIEILNKCYILNFPVDGVSIQMTNII